MCAKTLPARGRDTSGICTQMSLEEQRATIRERQRHRVIGLAYLVVAVLCAVAAFGAWPGKTPGAAALWVLIGAEALLAGGWFIDKGGKAIQGEDPRAATRRQRLSLAITYLFLASFCAVVAFGVWPFKASADTLWAAMAAVLLAVSVWYVASAGRSDKGGSARK
jgi:hypothetical protein